MRALLILTCAVLSGCASGPKYGEIERSIPELRPDMGRIYFYRNSALGAAIQPNIRLNGEIVGEMVPMGFFYVDRAPGTYTALARTESDAVLELQLKASETLYVRGSISFGWLVGRPYLQLIEAWQALPEVRETSYIGTTSMLAGSAPASPAPTASEGGALKDLDGLLPAGGKK